MHIGKVLEGRDDFLLKKLPFPLKEFIKILEEVPFVKEIEIYGTNVVVFSIPYLLVKGVIWYGSENEWPQFSYKEKSVFIPKIFDNYQSKYFWVELVDRNNGHFLGGKTERIEEVEKILRKAIIKGVKGIIENLESWISEIEKVN